MNSLIPVSASSWVPISAIYAHDKNITIKNSRVQWADGYSAFGHDAFETDVDFSINRDTIFYLPSAKTLFTFLQETSLPDIHLGAYVTISINASSYFSGDRQYVTSLNNDLYLTPLSSDNSFFRVELDTDGSFSLYQGPGLYVTVDNKKPFGLTLQSKLAESEKDRQRFNWYEKQNQIYITTKTVNPATEGAPIEEHFWSYSKAGPEKGKMRAIGMLPFNDYTAQGNYYKNDYLFDVTGFVVVYTPTGLVTEHTWVRYYNEFLENIHNKDAEIFDQKSVSAVFINHLFDLPYNTKIDITNKTMAINLANLKNVMTGEYEYRIKPG